MTYKQAIKLPKGGAVCMNDENLRATASEMIGRKFCLRPEAIYDWSKKHSVDLTEKVIGKVTLKNYIRKLIIPILNDNPMPKI